MIPSVINQGDSISWNESDSVYPASSGWVIGYNLVISSLRINFESNADVDNHVFDLTSETTTGWAVGSYSFQRYAKNGNERVTLNRGTVDINRDLITAGDERSHAQICVDNIEAVLEKRATLDQEEYTIDNRSLKRMNISDLLSLRDTYRAELAREKNAERIAQGLGTKQIIRVRF